VVGGSLVVLLLMLVPWFFTPFSDIVSVSQARRAAGFIPLPFAFAGGLAVLAGLLGIWVLPLALGAGLLFQALYPGDFEYSLGEGGPAWAAWVALGGAVAALAWGFRRRPGTVERRGALAAGLFLVPVAVHGFWSWSPSTDRPPNPLTPGLVDALRREVPARDVVYSNLETSYRIAAFAPVYVCNAPPAHVADTKENRPYERRAEMKRFFSTGDLEIPRACGARWLVLDTRRYALDEPPGPVVYEDDRYILFRIRSPERA
jgi:hypothetical protein